MCRWYPRNTRLQVEALHKQLDRALGRNDAYRAATKGHEAETRNAEKAAPKSTKNAAEINLWFRKVFAKPDDKSTP